MVDKLERKENRFRGKTEYGKWVYGGLYDDKIVRSRDDVDLPICLLVDRITTVKKETIGQYTGLKDKDSAKIYEGDIISFYNDEEYKITPTNGLVIYDSGAFMVEHKEMGKEYLGELDIEEMCVKVMGNIHDNPELLKG